LEKARAEPEGTPLVAKALLHLGSRAAVDQALSRLVRGGQLLRIGRGLYMLPIQTRFGTRGPAVGKVIESIGEIKGETLVPSGAAEANALGLTTQVPMRPVYLTSGRSRRLSVGSQAVELRHAPGWQLALPVGRAGQALRVLAWLGRERASEAVKLLREKLSGSERQELAGVQGRVPDWVAMHVGTIAYG